MVRVGNVFGGGGKGGRTAAARCRRRWNNQFKQQRDSNSRQVLGRVCDADCMHVRSGLLHQTRTTWVRLIIYIRTNLPWVSLLRFRFPTVWRVGNGCNNSFETNRKQCLKNKKIRNVFVQRGNRVCPADRKDDFLHRLARSSTVRPSTSDKDKWFNRSQRNDDRSGALAHTKLLN